MIGSPEDFFWKLRDVFRADPVLQRAYDALGAPMDLYREAKAQFIEAVMATEAFRCRD